MIRLAHIRNILVLVVTLIILVPLSTRADTCSGAVLLDASGNVTGSCSADGTQNPGDIPSPASVPYLFQNEGIFGCSQQAGAAMSVGRLATNQAGSQYVPVNDEAVTLNTGILVYKECVLRPLLDRYREAATAGLLKKAVTGIETGREGNPLRSVNPAQEDTDIYLKEFIRSFTDGTADSIDPKFRSAVLTATARTVKQRAYAPEQDLVCPFQGDASQDIFGAILSLQYPQCNPLGAYYLFYDQANARGANAVAYNQEQRQIGRGFYAVTDNPDDPLRQKILTPASVVQESFQQILGSPVRQLESANDIGQMIGALFSGITTQITTDSRGLAGLTQSVAGQPSYLEQVAKESSQGVVGAAVNAALQILRAARQVEGAYLSAMNAIATSLTQTIAQLRGAETQCWNLVVPKAKEYAASAGIALDANKIQLATSSMAFSQQVINSQISSLATSSIANVQASQKALILIDQLIAGVTNVSSLNAQRISLQQLDSLVAQKMLHTQYDAGRAAQQKQNVEAAMSTLLTDTVTAWADSIDLAVGWCNVNNPEVGKMWAGLWKK